jgi:hypothetical protein
MGKRVRPEDALAQDRRHKGLGIGDDVDLHLIEEGQLFLKILRVALVLPQR